MKKRTVVVAVAVILVLAAAAGAVYFRSRPMLAPDSAPHVQSIHAYFGRGETSYACDISGEELPDGVEDALAALFLGAEMRSRLLPRPQSFQVSDGSVALYIKVLLEDDDLFVNLGTDPQFCSAQFGDTHYVILDHQTLYQEAWALLEGTVTARAHEW